MQRRVPGLFTFWGTKCFLCTNAALDVRGHREKLDQLRKRIGVKGFQPLDWRGVTKQKVMESGGKDLLDQYNGSLFEILDSLFPEEYWYSSIRLDPRFWDSPENQRKFMRKFAEHNGVKDKEDWKKVKFQSLAEQGGGKLLKKYGSLRNLLQEMFPDEVWDFPEKRLPRGYWKNIENQRQHLKEIERKLGITSYKDWKNITSKQLKKQKMGSYLMSIHGGLYNMLTALYPDLVWDEIEDLSRVPRNYWKDKRNHREFLEKVRKKIGFTDLNEWHHVPWSEIRACGGSTLLRYYNSHFEMLQTVYSEHKWDIFSFAQAPKNFWKHPENHKAFLEHIYKERKFSSLEDWNNITWREFAAIGGASILRYYPGGMLELLQTHYPDHNWDIHDRKQVTRGYWQDTKNQRSFLDQLAVKLNISSPSEWKNVSSEDLCKNGGSSLLYYYPSFYDALVSVYPEIDWNVFEVRKSLPRKYFLSAENQLKFLQDLQRKEQLKSTDELISVPLYVVRNHGGHGLLNLYGNQWINVLRNVYPEKDWDIGKLCQTPLHIREDLEHQRDVFDRIGKELGVQSLDDWSSIQYSQIVKLGGAAILNLHGSLHEALENIYPEHEWNILSRGNVPLNYWNDRKHVQQALEEVKRKFKINEKDEWYRLSGLQLGEIKGGNSLIRKYRNMYALMSFAYPEEKWDKKRFSKRDKRAGQRWLFLQVQELFPGEEIIEDFYHDELSNISSFPIQLDIFVPGRNLGFEYQGKHHYIDIPAFGHLDMQQHRDKAKETLCHEQGLALVVIPYWWDRTAVTLREYVNQKFPQLLPSNCTTKGVKE